MNTKNYVDSLFLGYEENAGLADFKEELVSNLNEKIAALVRGGMSEEAAFEKASAQLSGISALADEISFKKKQEVIGEAFMDIRSYMTPRRVAAYVIFGLITAFGIICAFLAAFSTDNFLTHFDAPSGAAAVTGASAFKSYFISGIVPFLGVIFAFIPLCAGAFTYLGLTQELPGLYPLSGKRAAWYAAAVFALCAGLTLFPLTWFSTPEEVKFVRSFGVLIPFALPSAGLLVYLILTEKDRRKPWLRELGNSFNWMAGGGLTQTGGQRPPEIEFFSHPEKAARFGMFSGALWIFAIGIFLAAGFSPVGFKYSWLVFIFAIALQLFIQGCMMKKSEP